jgi:tetratricopeptide (TPR) repeat protein
MTALPSILHEPIQALLDEGDALFDQGTFDAALDRYLQAFELLPPQVERWEAATWLLTAIGDTYFQMGEWQNGRQALEQARQCPQGEENPFILLRLGQCELELGRADAARELLKQAFSLGGDEVFEDEDDKYRAELSR